METPPPPPIIFKDISHPNKLYIVGKGIYQKMGKIFGFLDFMCDFRVMVEI